MYGSTSSCACLCRALNRTLSIPDHCGFLARTSASSQAQAYHATPLLCFFGYLPARRGDSADLGASAHYRRTILAQFWLPVDASRRARLAGIVYICRDLHMTMRRAPARLWRSTCGCGSPAHILAACNLPPATHSEGSLLLLEFTFIHT